MNATIHNMQDVKLDKLEYEISTLIADAKQAKAEAAKKDKTLPWNVGELLAEAREEFGPDNNAYGKWVCQLTEKLANPPKQSALNYWKNLATNFGHLRPEIEDSKVTALYKLNKWANENPGMTLDAVKAKLAEEPKKPQQYSWKKQAGKVGLDVMAGGTGVNVKNQCLAINPALTFKKDDADNLQAALEQVYANQHPDDAEQEAEQAKADYLAAKPDKVNTVAKLEAKLNKFYQAYVDKALKEHMDKIEAELEKAAAEKYAKLWEKADKMNKEAEARKKTVYQMHQEVDFFLSKTEFKQVLSCLHPDKEADPEKKAKAFTIFNKLGFAFK